MGFLRNLFTKEVYTKHTKTEAPNHLIYFLGFLLLPFALLIFLILSIFKVLVTIYLFLNLGKKFHGLLDGSDAVWAIETKEWRNIIPFIYFVKSDTQIDALEKTKKLLKQKVFDHPHDYRKLTSTYETFVGYVYLLYDTYTLEDCVKPMEIGNNNSNFITEDELKDFVEQYGQSPFPKNGRALWQVYVPQKPILNSEKGQHSYVYPVLVKMQHMVGDGAAMVSFTDKIWADWVDGRPNSYIDKVIKSKAEKFESNKDGFDNLEQSIMHLLKAVGHYVRLAYVWIGSLIFLFYIRERDENALHGPALSGDKIVSWTWEDHEELVPLVKKIKNSIPNTSFNDVVYTALSVSFSNYFERRGYKKPKYFSTAIPAILSLRNMGQPGPVVLKNDFAMVFGKLSSKMGTLSDTFSAVKEQFALLRNNLDFLEINYLTVKYLMNPVPLPLISAISTVSGISMATSNLPGGDKITVLDGHEMHNLAFFTLHRWKTGISAAIITYDNRFHLSFLIDKALISSRQEVQKIANDFFDTLKLLDKELSVKYK